MKITAKDWNVIHDYAEMHGLTPQLSTPSLREFRFTHRKTGVEVVVDFTSMKNAVELAKKRDGEK